MKNTRLYFLGLLFFTLITFSNTSAQSGTVQDTIKTLIDTQIICLNNEDVSGYMKTIHPQAEGYNMMKQVLQMTFKNFDFTTSVDSTEFVTITDNSIVTNMTISVKTADKTNTRTISQEFRRFKGSWYFYGTALK